MKLSTFIKSYKIALTSVCDKVSDWKAMFIGSIAFPDETRMKLSESHKNKIPWNKGKKMSDEQKAKLQHKKSDSHKESLKRSMSKRTSAYYEYKEHCPDVKWAYFLKNIWPMIKGDHVG